jgi:hypothetical protein
MGSIDTLLTSSLTTVRIARVGRILFDTISASTPVSSKFRESGVSLGKGTFGPLTQSILTCLSTGTTGGGRGEPVPALLEAVILIVLQIIGIHYV